MYVICNMGCLWLELILRFVGLIIISWILSEVVILVLALWRTLFQVEAFLQRAMQIDEFRHIEDFEE